MGWFDKWSEQAIALRFGRDPSGRSVFLPFGPRKAGYYMDASHDPQAIKSLIKMYVVAAAFINLLGNFGSYAFTESLVFSERSTTLAHKLKTGITVYSICVAIFTILPALVLSRMYKGFIRDCCSSFTPVDPEAMRQVETPYSPIRRKALIVCVSMILIGLAVLAAGWYLIRVRCPS
jgi:hypothetical protein